MPSPLKASSVNLGDGPHAADAHVGGRIRLRRTLQGMSQSELADALGMTFQQIQKYEKGTNRVSASKLWDIAHALKVPVSYFFEELPSSFTPAGQKVVAAPDLSTSDESSSRLTKRETLELVRYYYNIPDSAVRQRLVDLVTTLSADDPPPSTK